MVNYEGLRERKGLTQVPRSRSRPIAPATSPHFLHRSTIRPHRVYGANGQVTSVLPFPGKCHPPPNRLSSVTTTVFRSMCPCPNAGLHLTKSRLLLVNSEGRNSDANQMTTRLDFVRNPSDTWFFRYSRNHDIGYVPRRIFPTRATSTFMLSTGVLADTRVLGANKVNEFRLHGLSCCG